MEKGDHIATVDSEDFKKVWNLRNELPLGCSVDVDIYRSICKPDTDVLAAAHRAAFLSVILQVRPQDLGEFAQNGKPSDALLDAFGQIPITVGAPVNVLGLLREVKKS